MDWLIGFRQADLDFHDAITEASGNPILECLLKAINPMFTMRWLDWKTDIGEGFPLVAQDVWNEHMMIMNAIVAQRQRHGAGRHAVSPEARLNSGSGRSAH